MISLFIPKFLPATLNKVMRGHWGNGHKLKKADRDIVGIAALNASIPKASGKRRVSFLFILKPGARRFDRDAPLKSALDSLVACGLLRQDSPNWCEIGRISFARAEEGGEWGSLIVLEDL